MGKPDGPGTCPTARLLGRGRPTPSTTRPQEPRPTAAGFPVGGVLGVRRALVLGGQGNWFGVVLEFRGFRCFQECFGVCLSAVWSLECFSIVWQGVFFTGWDGLEENWFGVGQGGVKCVNFNGLAGLASHSLPSFFP